MAGDIIEVPRRHRTCRVMPSGLSRLHCLFQPFITTRRPVIIVVLSSSLSPWWPVRRLRSYGYKPCQSPVHAGRLRAFIHSNLSSTLCRQVPHRGTACVAVLYNRACCWTFLGMPVQGVEIDFRCSPPECRCRSWLSGWYYLYRQRRSLAGGWHTSIRR